MITLPFRNGTLRKRTEITGDVALREVGICGCKELLECCDIGAAAAERERSSEDGA